MEAGWALEAQFNTVFARVDREVKLCFGAAHDRCRDALELGGTKCWRAKGNREAEKFGPRQHPFFSPAFSVCSQGGTADLAGVCWC